MKKKKLKQTHGSAHLLQYRSKIREGSPEEIRVTMEERIVTETSFDPGVKDRGSDRCACTHLHQ